MFLRFGNSDFFFFNEKYVYSSFFSQSQEDTCRFFTCTMLMIIAAKFASMVEPAALNILEALALTMKKPVQWSKNRYYRHFTFPKFVSKRKTIEM